MWRADLILAGAVCLGGCIPARALPATPTASPQALPPTATAFLPRGFAGLPSEAATVQGSGSAAAATFTAPATRALDLSMAADRLTRLRAENGVPALISATELDEMAQARAETMARAALLQHTLAGGSEHDLAGDLASAGFGGQVAEVALSINPEEADPLGLVLQALLTDPANRLVMLDATFRLGGFGAAERDGVWYVIGLLAEEGPSG